MTACPDCGAFAFFGSAAPEQCPFCVENAPDEPEGEAVNIKPLFAWYDLWIGVYWDRKGRKLYVFPIPCFGIVVSFGAQP